jgi:uncharacterized protein with PCYCGC motif
MGGAKRRNSVLVIAIASVALIALAAWAGVSFYGSRPGPASEQDALQPASAAQKDPAQQLRMTLDPNLFQGEVKKSYQIAERDPALLAQLHCYCGCDRTNNHKNLLDCYRDDHGSHCAICVGEAIDAEKLARQGMPIDQIRDTLRSRYAHGH